MANLNDIVTINISLQTAAVKQEGFGIPMILDYHTRFAERIRFYSSLDGMLADNFTVNDAAYKAASAVFAQSPQVPLLAIGRKANAPVQKVSVTPIASNGHVYTVSVLDHAGVGGTASYTSDSDATVAEIVAGLKSAIDALSTGLTTTNSTTSLDITEASPGLWFAAWSDDLAFLKFAQTQTDPGIAADLAAIKLVDNSWFGVGSTTSSSAEILTMAAWVEANKKQALQDSQDTDIILATGGNVALLLEAAKYTLTSIEYGNHPQEFAAFGLFGAVYPYPPGGITYKFRQVRGVSSVPLTETHILNLQNAHANSFTDFGGLTISFEGRSAQGEYNDVIRDRYWFESRMQARVYSLLANAQKIPFTDAGIAAVEGQVRAQMVEGVTSGFLAEDPPWIVVAPKAADVSPTDKAARRLTGITFQGTLAGAIHFVTITGTITL